VASYSGKKSSKIAELIVQGLKLKNGKATAVRGETGARMNGTEWTGSIRKVIQ